MVRDKSLFFTSIIILFLLGYSVYAVIISGYGGMIDFKNKKNLSGVTWSDNFQLSGRGLSTPFLTFRTVKSAWVQTNPITPGQAWRPPSSMDITLTVQGLSWSEFPFHAYLSYGCDDVHWSKWIEVPAKKMEHTEGLKTYYYQLIVPKQEYENYMSRYQEWWKTQPKHFDDEDAYCRWLLKTDPKFFDHSIPLIGYIYFRLEKKDLRNYINLSSLQYNISYAIGGLESYYIDNNDREWQNKPWHLDAKNLGNEKK